MASSPGLSWSALHTEIPDARESVPPVAADMPMRKPVEDGSTGDPGCSMRHSTLAVSGAASSALPAAGSNMGQGGAAASGVATAGAEVSAAPRAAPASTGLSETEQASPLGATAPTVRRRSTQGVSSAIGARGSDAGGDGSSASAHRRTHSSGAGANGASGARAVGGDGSAGRVRSSSGAASGGGGGGGKGGGKDGDGAAAASAIAAASTAPLQSLEPGNSMVELVSREVIRKLRLAASAGSAEDRHVVCEELFADITCALDAAARAALLAPTKSYGSGGGGGDAASGAAVGGAGAGAGTAAGSGGAAGGRAAGTRGGRLYYEVLAVHYASRSAADSARALLHLCQLLWDTPWVAPIYALLLHRFLLLPRDVGGASTPTLTPSTGTGSSGGAAAAMAAPPAGPSFADQRVKHLNVLTHGSRQLLLGDVHSGLSRFQPLWSFLALEVAGLGDGLQPPPPSATPSASAAAALPPVARIDTVPAAARPWLLAVAAAFLPYYALDEQVYDMARRFPSPVPASATAASPAAAGGGAIGAAVLATAAAPASLAGLDFLLVEVTDVLGRINSEVGLLKYLRALRALARPPPPPLPLQPATAATPAAGEPQSHLAAQAEAEGGGAAKAESTGRVFGTEQTERQQQQQPAAAAVAHDAEDGAAAGGGGVQDDVQGLRQRPSPAPPQPLAGLPTITKLRLQNELYSLTSGGGPRYAPPEVRRAAFAALDALFPGGRSLRWLVRWASRTLHLEWLGDEAAASESDPWAGRGWLGWIYWPIHWCTALYGRILLAIFQVLYGMVVWRAWRGVGGGDAAVAAAGGRGVSSAAAAGGVVSGGVGVGGAIRAQGSSGGAGAGASGEGPAMGTSGGGKGGGGAGEGITGPGGEGGLRKRRSAEGSRAFWWRGERQAPPQRQQNR